MAQGSRDLRLTAAAIGRGTANGSDKHWSKFHGDITGLYDDNYIYRDNLGYIYIDIYVYTICMYIHMYLQYVYIYIIKLI
jgi:hypothetical protein